MALGTLFDSFDQPIPMSESASESRSRPYPEVDSQADYPAIERAVLDRWQRQKTFRKSVEQRGAAEYVFYDGPPFANGLPHYGHLLTGYVKDVVPRYQTMRGQRVERRFGWDCHGLPAELEAEKELGVSGRRAIEEFGIEKFNDACRTSVLKYTGEWENYVNRQARWVDFEKDYKTMDLSYMESVLWAFKQLWDKGLVYEGARVMPYSWAAETPLSNFETRMDNSYRSRQDPAVTVGFDLEPRDGDLGPLRIFAWTTTPWTLPSNLALAVGPELDYAIVRRGGAGADEPLYVLGREAVERYAKELSEKGGAEYEILDTCKGKDLVGRKYTPLFPYFEGHANAFRVLSADFVEVTEGTGIVHMAPGFGEDDQRVCEENGIDLVVPVDEKGRYTKQIADYEGQLVFDANKPIAKRLKEEGRVLKHATYDHNYPHCWRTDEPLIYKALNSFYVEVTKFKERMLEVNQQIRWIPDHVRDGQFGRWLENARDWSISRNRFWGSPIPVWKSDDPNYPRTEVYGSIAELEEAFGTKVTDLHRPAIDQLVRPNPDDPTGKSMMRRVPDVLDCWFESGSMPFAQVHYPFENKEWFEDHFPADFIVEYIAQTRGWFYTLVVLSTALFDKPPFQNVICHGVVLDENGQKLSKRLRNYPDPEEVFDTIGSDALRWFLMSSQVLRGGDLEIEKDGRSIREVVRLVLNPVWNAYAFFTLYANADSYEAVYRTDSSQMLDRYILGKTRALVLGVQERMDSYDLAGTCQDVVRYLDALNNWYIRRSRPRFWSEGQGAAQSQDKTDAFDTLYTVLVTLSRALAPLLPLVSEEIHSGLTGEDSVHLVDWPDVSAWPEESALVASMDKVRDVCSAGLALRKAGDLRARLPLRQLTVAGAGVSELAGYEDLVRDELNVKEVELSTAGIEQFASFALQVNARIVGPKLGGDMKTVMAASKKGDWKALSDREDGTPRVEVAGRELVGDEFDLRLKSKEGVTSQALPGNRAIVVLDTEVTPELEAEGTARDLVRLVQQARKDAGFHVSDRIVLTLQLDEKARQAVEAHRAYVSEQVLATTLEFGEPSSSAHTERKPLAGGEAGIGIGRVS